jgi:hypothetical protein
MMSFLPHQLLHFLFIWVPQLPGKSHFLHSQDCIPCDINLPPLKTMPAAVFKSVMVIVPSFAQGENSNHGIIHGEIIRLEHLATPDVADGVHSPGYVPGEDGSQGKAPDQTWKSSHQEVNDWLSHCNIQVVLLKPNVKVIFFQIFGIGSVKKQGI